MMMGHALCKRSGLLMVFVLLTAWTGAAVAQTPPDACAADSLYLISPSSLQMRLQTTGGPRGMVVSWPNLDLEQATCYVLRDTAALDFQVDVSGGFGDKVDRLFRFTTADSGEIGGSQGERLIYTWQHEGPSNNGSLAGMLNLANNGGVWRYHAGADQWTQVNQGLPMTWKQVNVVALGTGPDGTLVAGFTRGQSRDADPAGLYINRGAGWQRIAEETFDSFNLITHIAVSQDDSDHFMVGTKSNGLYVTTDGGQSFTQWTTGLDPLADPQPGQFPVRALAWSGSDVFLYIDGYGVFRSPDSGASFSKLDFLVPETLDSADPNYVSPVINDFVVDPANPARVLACLQFHGVYESDDYGLSWHDLYGDLLVPDPDGEVSGLWVHTALAAAVDPLNPSALTMFVSQKGLFRTEDGGQHWFEVGGEVQPENRATLLQVSMTTVPDVPGRILAVEDGYAVLRSDDGGATWSTWSTVPPLATRVGFINHADGGGDLLLATYRGGIYVPGSVLPLSETYTSGTSVDLRDLDLGLGIAFSGGVAQPDEAFYLVCQTFQGWAVWRAPEHDRQHPVLLGLYDRVNPESCIEGFCGDSDFQIKPQCFAAKRAACFDFSDPDTFRFFDSEVYNGFSYYYSVTTFDYGNTALVTPENNSNEMLFSPRWTGDELSPFAGPGNSSYVQVNLEAEPDTGGEEIYVFPNPLRPGAGIPGEEGRTVVFTNLPRDSKIRIFTTAGDDVIELGPELMHGGQIYWNTENHHNQSVAPGVYLFKVIMPKRSAYWGKLVIIR